MKGDHSEVKGDRSQLKGDGSISGRLDLILFRAWSRVIPLCFNIYAMHNELAVPSLKENEIILRI